MDFKSICIQYTCKANDYFYHSLSGAELAILPTVFGLTPVITKSSEGNEKENSIGCLSVNGEGGGRKNKRSF